MADAMEQAELVQLIHEADLALVQMEQARTAVDMAKLHFEMAKEDFEARRQVFDQVIASADTLGVPRGKLKKLAEERSAALLASGLLAVPANAGRPGSLNKPPKSVRKTKEPKSLPEDSFTSDPGAPDMDAPEALSLQ